MRVILPEMTGVLVFVRALTTENETCFSYNYNFSTDINNFKGYLCKSSN